MPLFLILCELNAYWSIHNLQSFQVTFERWVCELAHVVLFLRLCVRLYGCLYILCLIVWMLWYVKVLEVAQLRFACWNNILVPNNYCLLLLGKKNYHALLKLAGGCDYLLFGISYDFYYVASCSILQQNDVWYIFAFNVVSNHTKNHVKFNLIVFFIMILSHDMVSYNLI